METVQINIPKEVFDDIKNRVDSTEFDSVDEYATYVLKQVLQKFSDGGERENDSQKSEEMAKQRLRSLGYLE
jgi:Arc/MetJ-type ribon-helix-helix transcriptional regulator